MAVITISRQFGSGGISIAKIVSEKLGYALYDRRILNLIAEKANVSTHWVEYFEKQVGSKFQKMLRSKSTKNKLETIISKNSGFLNEKIFIKNLIDTIKIIAQKGDAVIVGRGCQYILNRESDVLHILLIARKKDRKEFLVEKYGIEYHHAERVIHDEDLRRHNFYDVLGKTDYDKPINYTMVVNMSKVSLPSACNLICSLI